MYRPKLNKYIGILGICLGMAACKIPAIAPVNENKVMPAGYNATNSSDTTTLAALQWRTYFKDPNLVNLIDSALKNNQELNITLREVEMARNNIRFTQGKLLPTVGVRVGGGIEKVGRYTSQGAGDASTDITPGREVPDALTDITIAAYANWEVDIWKKLRNSKKAAVAKYLSSMEGKNFVLTNLIAEVANSYYELVALDNQLEIVRQNIALQKNALEIVKVQKIATRVTELAVQKFRAEVLDSQSLEFEIKQSIKEAENKINFLLGRYPQDIPRDKSNFVALMPAAVMSGIPSQLLANRPDIRQAELDLAAAKLNVKVARAEFYPQLDISAAVGFQAFKPSYLFMWPASILYSLAGDLVAPLVNRSAIKAEFGNANAEQIQAMYNYQRVVLNAYLEVSNQLSRISNLEESYKLRKQQVEALTLSIDISNDLFRSARADYLEVLLTQRDALSKKLELIETKKQQLNAVVNVYRDLGGGWK